MFCTCEGKNRPDIILHVMKYEPKITWKTKKTKSNELSLAKLHPRNDTLRKLLKINQIQFCKKNY